MMGVLWGIIKFVLMLIFPFLFLIRFSVHLHIHEGLIPWACIAGGVLFTSLILFFYFTFFYGKFFGKNLDTPSVMHRLIMALALVLLYCIHGLFYFSGSNMKDSELRKEIRQVHPILRLSLSTLIHVDKTLIITDGDRLPEDYKKMGLPSKAHSLHYKQANGYAHAIDLRTKGRSEMSNFFVKLYFKLMGFNTLRHGGTADHLHISLFSHDRPGSI